MKDPNEALKKADEALRKLVDEKKRADAAREKEMIMESVGRELPGMVAPLLHQVAAASRLNTDEVIAAIKGVTINPPPVTVTTPEANVTVSHEMPSMPEIPPIDTSGIESAIERGIANAKFPKPEVVVNTPKIPDFPKFPDIPDFPTEVSIKGVDKNKPFPVMMMDSNGKPMQFSFGGSGGGRSDFFTIKDIQASSGVSIIDQDTGAMKVSGSFSVTSSNSSTQSIDSSGNAYSVANPFPVQVVSGGTATSAVNIVDSTGVAFGGSNPIPVTFTGSSSTNISMVNSDGTYYNSDNPLPVTFSAASVQPVSQVSGAAWSVSVTDVFGSTGSNVINPDGRIKVELPTGASGLTDTELRASSVPVAQVSGAAWSTFITGATGTIGVVTLNPDGNPVYGGTSSGGTVQVQDSTGSSITSFGSGDSKGLAVAIVDASGNQITSFGGGTQYTDGSTGSTPTGTVSMGDTGEESGNLFALSTYSGVVSSGTLRVSHATDVGVSVNILNSSIAVTGTVAVSGITNTIGSNIVDSSGVAYSGSNPVPISGAVSQSGTWNIGTVTTVTGVTNSVQSALIDSSGVQYSGSNPVPITGTVAATKSGTWAIDNPVNQGDAATALRVVVAGNSDASVSATQVGTWNIGTVSTVTGVTNSIAVVSLDRDGNPLTTGPINEGDAATALRVVLANNVGYSVTATQTGTWNIGTVTTVTGITNSVASALIDSSGVQYSTSNPVPISDAGGSVTVDGTVAVSGITNSVSASIVDSSGVQYSGSNPFAVSVRDSYGSTITSFGSGDSKGLAVAIVDAAGAQITSFGGGTQYAEGATASTYTGTAVMFAEASSDAAKVVSSVDPLPVTLSTALSSSIDSVRSRPISLRGNISTAYATLNSNSETTLLAANAGFFSDLIYIKFSNTSSGAVTIDLRDSSGGNIVDTYEVPANGTNGISLPVPYPQGNQGNIWTVDYNDADLSNTTVYVSAMFDKTT